jgi:hypothetical protein
MKRKMTFGKFVKYLLVVLQILNCGSDLIQKIPKTSLKIEVEVEVSLKKK